MNVNKSYYWFCPYCDCEVGDYNVTFEENCAICGGHVENRECEGNADKSVSDGYHTFDELYAHRHALFGALCKLNNGWKSKFHDDGTFMPGWFIAGTRTPAGDVTYHLPESMFDDFPAMEIERAPKWDGHSPDDVINRIRSMWEEKQ